MREVKFRGLDIANGEWIYGSLVKVYENYHILEEGETQAHEYNMVEEDSIGEYTGLKDMNGKDIYEGDVLEFEKGEFIYLDYDTKNKKLVIVNLTGAKDNIFTNFAEIIGNFFENKELLKLKIEL